MLLYWMCQPMFFCFTLMFWRQWLVHKQRWRRLGNLHCNVQMCFRHHSNSVCNYKRYAIWIVWYFQIMCLQVEQATLARSIDEVTRAFGLDPNDVQWQAGALSFQKSCAAVRFDVCLLTLCDMFDWWIVYTCVFDFNLCAHNNMISMFETAVNTALYNPNYFLCLKQRSTPL